MGIIDVIGKAASVLSPRKRTTALILAAGNGARFSEGDPGSNTKKQFILIGGEPVVLRTVRAFDECELVDEIIVVTGDEDVPMCRQVLSGKVKKPMTVVAGGATRQESAMNGLEAVSPKSDYIAIHDGARCLVTPEIIEKVVREAYKHGAAAAAEKAVDTVKYADGAGIIENTIDRDHVWLMKTPQIFLANMYRAGVYTAKRDGATVTDDCMLVERLGFKVKTVDCGHENIKITFKEDKIIAEAILAARREAAERNI